jgi:hypothetical protein
MSPTEWKEFLQSLRSADMGDVADKFEEEERKVEREMAVQAKKAALMIEHANLVQIVADARREGRIVHCLDRNGQNIIH